MSFCNMVANVMRSRTSYGQTTQDSLNSVNALTQDLVLTFGTGFPRKNQDMDQNVILKRPWPWKVKIIGHNKLHHQFRWL